MAWTQDDLQSLEQLLDSKMRSKIPGPINIDQARARQHLIKQEKPEQVWISRILGQLQSFGDWVRQVEFVTWLRVTRLISVFCQLWSLISIYNYETSETACIKLEKATAIVKGYHIQVNQPGNYTVAVPSIWSAAPASMPTETATTTATQEITKTVTTTATERTTATVTEVRIPPSVKDYHVHVNQGCMSVMVGNRQWLGCREQGENIDDLIRRLMDESRGVSG